MYKGALLSLTNKSYYLRFSKCIKIHSSPHAKYFFFARRLVTNVQLMILIMAQTRAGNSSEVAGSAGYSVWD